MTQADDEIDRRNRQRDEQTLDAAWQILQLEGLKSLTREAIAAQAGLSPASVSNFGRHRISNGTHDKTGYRERVLAALMARAVEQRDLRILRIGLLDGCLSLDDVPQGLRASVRI